MMEFTAANIAWCYKEAQQSTVEEAIYSRFIESRCSEPWVDMTLSSLCIGWLHVFAYDTIGAFEFKMIEKIQKESVDLQTCLREQTASHSIKWVGHRVQSRSLSAHMITDITWLNIEHATVIRTRRILSCCEEINCYARFWGIIENSSSSELCYSSYIAAAWPPKVYAPATIPWATCQYLLISTVFCI